MGIFSALTGGSGLSSSSGATIGTPIGWAQNFSAAASDLGPGGAGPAFDWRRYCRRFRLAGYRGDAGAGRFGSGASWATAGGRAASSAPGPGVGWTSAAAHDAAVTAGMPAGTAGRAGLGFGTPRYGTKPTVIPKPTVT
ncbi:polymorphic PE/PPE family protein [Mycobacterium kansasii 732]|uniref:PPE family protein, SVP subgroup n=1 Tax=Mycobacterium pseudokansasii TaxID=2341080 RepID=UPI000449EF0A|nr:hypothetical protein [Mycobacterium pseudokansasii]EUA11954.1 polymorphic PE/PPE family protein [Mycobacterium kansasii 732]